MKMIKMNLKKRFIVVASFSCTLFSCSLSAEEYAQRWCELNSKIVTADEMSKMILIKQAQELEKEIDQVYGKDEEKMALIYALTDECD